MERHCSDKPSPLFRASNHDAMQPKLIYIYIYIYIHTHTYIHTYINTHTHTHPDAYNRRRRRTNPAEPDKIRNSSKTPDPCHEPYIANSIAADLKKIKQQIEGLLQHPFPPPLRTVWRPSTGVSSLSHGSKSSGSRPSLLALG